MRLYVYVLQAKDLPVMKDAYVKLQVGKHKSTTRTLKGSSCGPVWNEEFVFRVHDAEEEVLVVSVFNHDNDDDLVGRVRIPLSWVASETNYTLPPTWFSLEKARTGKFINVDCGKILLTVSLHGKGCNSSHNHFISADSNVKREDYTESDIPLSSSHGIYRSKAPCLNISDGKKLMKTIASRIEKVFNKNEDASRPDNSSDSTTVSSDFEDCVEEHPSTPSFEEAIEMMASRTDQQEVPENLQGGILVDQICVLPTRDLNKFLFAPGSQFRKDLADLQGTTDAEEGPWTRKSTDMSCLRRIVTYTNAATKLVKAVKATEEQTYLRADGQEFVVLVNVCTPEVPYGNTFNVELLYKIVPGPESSLGEESSHVTVSWGIRFHQSTMMKGMIEGGVKQGLKDSFDQFAKLLAQNIKTMDSVDSRNKEHTLATLEAEHQSDWEMATSYFWNFSVVSTIFMLLYVLVHILLCKPRSVQGLEFNGLDLPDSFGQLITCAILVIRLERVYNTVSHFIEARLQRREHPNLTLVVPYHYFRSKAAFTFSLRVLHLRFSTGSDHGVKAHGDGWVLTVALIEGTNLPSLDSTGFADPYVLFACSGKTKISSVKLQTRDPLWNDILEFDAMVEPPSVLDVEVFDFDGPFDQATSLGHAEINFLKHTSTELADTWVSLEGKLAQSSQAKLHLGIFLENNKGVETIKEYLTKMEKEVGTRLTLRSPHRNAAFQKQFGLPPEEFLISDFTCQLKRKLPSQGRLFLSARILGFYANLFGHKTKFFFLWEDIEDIQVMPPTLSSVGSPSLVIVLRKDRGLDARDWAKSQDEEGRLKYYFQSFVSFDLASRTIMALWRTRMLTAEQKAQIAHEQQDGEELPISLEDSGSILDVEETKMSKIYSAELPISMKSLMEMFGGGKMEPKIMEKSGCLNYATTQWKPLKPGGFERHVSYKFNRQVSIFGGEVTCTQQMFPIASDGGWAVNEVMALHDVPFGDHFHVKFRYLIEKSALADRACKCDVSIGITWLKSTKFHQRIARNITEKFTHRFKEIFELVEREIIFAIPQDVVLSDGA